MYRYNISKYNPLFRDRSWNYTIEDWTAISDVGKKFNHKILTVQDYLSVEDSYISAIRLILEFRKLKYLNISNVRKSFDEKQHTEILSRLKLQYSPDIIDTYNKVETIEKLEHNMLDHLLRLMLREDIGAKVYYPRKLKVFICYDFLMSVYSSQSLAKLIPEIELLGLYVEEF